jgi:hypothetical protein
MKAVVPQCAVLVFTLAATQLLAGCASTPDMAGPSAPDVASAAADQPAEITGSRIPARRNEKMVSQVGGQDYRNDRNALPAPLAAH